MPPLLLALVNAGVLTRGEAERIHRNLDDDAARLYMERALEQVMQNGLAGQRDRFLALVRGNSGRPTPAQIDAFWRAEDDLLLRAVQGAFVDAASDRAAAVAIRIAPDMWRMVNEQVIDWAQTYYASADVAAVGSVPSLNLTSRTDVLRAFTDWQLGELEMAGPVDGLPQLVRALTPTFGPARAERVAVTEVTRIFSEATRFAANANDAIQYFRWLTANDDLVCPICGPLHNSIITKTADGGYMHPTRGAVGYPPAHVRCRCALGVETALTVGVQADTRAAPGSGTPVIARVTGGGQTREIQVGRTRRG